MGGNRRRISRVHQAAKEHIQYRVHRKLGIKMYSMLVGKGER